MNAINKWAKFGMSYGISMVLFTLFSLHIYFVGIWFQSAISYLLLFVFFYLLAKSYKSENEGYLSYGEAFKYLFLMSLVGFAILFVFNAIYYNLIDPSAAEFLTQKAVEGVESTMRAMGVPEDQVVLAMETAEQNQTDTFSMPNLLLSLAGTLVFSLILSAIAALILKKEKKEN